MPQRPRNTMPRRSYCSPRWTTCRPMTNSWMRWAAPPSKCGKRSRWLHEEPRALLDAFAGQGKPLPYVSAIEGASQHFKQELMIEWFCEELGCTLFHGLWPYLGIV